MTTQVGKNTISGEQLRGYTERVEAIDVTMKELRDDKSAIFAEAKANGFVPAGIRYLVKVRAMKPHDRQEAEAIRDTYLHAVGMAEEPPLFRMMGLMEADVASRDAMIEHFKKFTPAEGQGDVILRMGGQPVRLWRDKSGEVHADPYVEKPQREASPRTSQPAPARQRAPAPDVDEAGAEEIGRQMARDNKPIIENPFPFGDPRRARCDAGWRAENGGDGMGPEEE